MKRTTMTMWIAAILILCSVGASAQSLGDYARRIRKDKSDTSAQDRHYDNDNLPTGEKLSVVGPPPSESAASAVAAAPAATKPEASKEELQGKIDTQKDKIDSLNRELDLEQREYKLRVAEFYADAGNRLRNSGAWDKDNAKYQSDIESKQKAIQAAHEEMENLQEQGRKAGLKQKDDADDTNKDNPKK